MKKVFVLFSLVIGLSVKAQITVRGVVSMRNGAPLEEQKITISAQYYLLDFYKKFGFQPIGEPYDDAGVKHIRMEKEFV